MIPPEGVGRLLFTRERLRRIVIADWRPLDVYKLLVIEAVLIFIILYLFTRA